MPQHDEKKILSIDDLEKLFYENQEDIEYNANPELFMAVP